MAQKSNFVDYVKIYFTSGAGGPGVVGWRREKFVPRGGPDGGDGGNGGSIYLEANAQLWTLLDLKYRKFIKAEHGQPGGKAKRKGRDGTDIVLKVPVGTVAYDAETDEPIGELVEHGQRLLLVPGGRGGLGNWQFRTPTNQAPDFAQQGGPAQQRTVVIELKVLADVGLVGFPNAGKSTLLAAVSAAKPEIADYPFTTLKPNLGIVRVRDFQTFAMADIPGIIEGASEGRGLGLLFLRHIERNAVLLFVVAAHAEDPAAQYATLCAELHAYDPDLLEKPRFIALSQCDIVDNDTRQAALEALAPAGVPIFAISAVTGEGLQPLLDTLYDAVARARDEALAEGQWQAVSWEEDAPQAGY